jgi:hypothetical protein
VLAVTTALIAAACTGTSTDENGVVLLDTPNPLDQVPALLRAGARAVGR